MLNICKAAASLGLMSTELCEQKFSDKQTKLEASFKDHLAKHGLSFSTGAEKALRKKLFDVIDQQIEEHNSQEDKSFEMAHNQFSTMTDFEKTNIIQKPDQKHFAEVTKMDKNSFKNGGIDWRTKGVLPPVRNQGQCGSPVVFAGIDAIESDYAITTGKMIDLSLQQVIDCDATSFGCGGQSFDDFENYVAKFGLETSQDYPQAATGKCHYDAMKVKVHAKFQQVKKDSV
jgi:cathepsin L